MLRNRILLLGSEGQLGWELHRTLAPLGEIFPFDINLIDLTILDETRQLIQSIQPTIIINASAYTAVDKAESEQELAISVNCLVPQTLAQEAAARNIVLIHYSTDYVFDGQKGSPYTESDIPNPINLYGKSKFEGEKVILNSGASHLILRTSWVYSLRRPSFVSKLRQWAKVQKVMKVVTDQVGSPSWSRMLAEITAHLIIKSFPNPTHFFSQHSGIYHLAGKGYVSRYDLARFVLENDPQRQEHVCKIIEPSLTTDFPTPALRPLFTALNCDKFQTTFGFCMPDWKISLKLALDE